MSPRLDPLPQADALLLTAPVDYEPAPARGTTAEVVASLPLRNGDRGSNFSLTLCRHPTIIDPVLEMRRFLSSPLTVLALRDQEIVILRTSRAADCPFEFNTHVSLARRAGISDEALMSLAGDLSTLDDRDRLLAAAVDELCATDTWTDATWERLRTEFDDASLVEVLAIVGYYRMLAGLINAFAVDPDSGLSDRWPTTIADLG